MRLITHNMLKSNIKGVEKGFPLGIEVLKKEEQELEFNSGAPTTGRWSFYATLHSSIGGGRCSCCRSVATFRFHLVFPMILPSGE